MEKLIEQFSLGLVFWSALWFLVLLFILRAFAWKPILKAVEEREKGIENAMFEAQKARAEIEELKRENENRRQQALAERDAILKEARDLKNQTINQAKEEAKKEADKIISNARESIQIDKNAALAEIKSEVAAMSIGIAEKILDKELNKDQAQHQYIDSLINDIKLS
ncbi:F-type ATPase subunit b [Candidatus Ornithobacterium hominis]|uniref:ATP synthase subunit b n=1 Tax=Candidatus Ornithobacterium hominis TaxID=2497989 RepID=A0A383TVC1_9FLAO|nr:F0F1 ATP synthase subunit B [Candidatus Ornithobacterium hominis]MCT7903589.1 F0F1 ATP synthase subunit B [Candidatus Ornithobacterium hominis]SZD70926.1 F-type ATPase subunit b [Candidatus Ornithobacterium hominis]